MTETQLIAYAAPLIIYIMAAVSIAMTAFLYLELKEKKARFKNFWVQERENDKLKDKNNELEKKNKELSSVIVNNVRADLKSVKIG
jgi:cell division protein FtsB|tara:strand:+ start:174 stop:431 length:258 start_codon:yes stop_codon:yes gene_type:complete